MPKQLNENDLKNRRLRECVQRFPGAESGAHSDKCCRFPKACSPYGSMDAVLAGDLTESGLEPPRKSMMEAMLETQLYTDKKVLEPMRVGRTFAIETKLLDELTPGDRQAAMDYELQRQRVALEVYVLSEKLAEDVYTDKKSYSTPKTWWDMFKVTYAMTWWLGWLVRRWPAEFDYHWFEVGVRIERYAQYPEANISLPDLGRPVRYERMAPLSFRELETMSVQQQLEEKAAKDRQLITVYSLIPETIPDLMEETGLDREWFDNAYKFDQDFGLQSKIYIVPAGVGYNK